jgi:hypothetical protein
LALLGSRSSIDKKSGQTKPRVDSATNIGTIRPMAKLASRSRGSERFGRTISVHIITSAWWFGAAFLALCLVYSAAAQVDQERAEAFFKEATAICQRDGGRLWGVSLCGPMVFADSRTRTIATNQPRPTDEQPRSLGFANSPMEWGGKRWAAFMWDFTISLPDARTRNMFMLHELSTVFSLSLD